ncbi:hypothetical protein SAMN05216466_106210 [Paraburkholderia phenazinium]|uniref:Uncharacterized protein n=1 Tax=Paraburkholderia phenazinium TaxID=60549 RepID=A0A1G7YIT1_9BURK|nr:hypothetical protein [Paraburkholderia phenazinium]SDG96482.1 hypothetical protein SAMN05216466_106210 [Paraburkholderia phenazinium]
MTRNNANPTITPVRILPNGALSDEISWRSKVFDKIGRVLIGPPEKLGVRSNFYFIQADRAQFFSLETLRENVRDQFVRRELRAMISRRMLLVGAVVVVIGVLCADGDALALAGSVAHFLN